MAHQGPQAARSHARARNTRHTKRQRCICPGTRFRTGSPCLCIVQKLACSHRARICSGPPPCWAPLGACCLGEECTTSAMCESARLRLRHHPPTRSFCVSPPTRTAPSACLTHVQLLPTMSASAGTEEAIQKADATSAAAAECWRGLTSIRHLTRTPASRMPSRYRTGVTRCHVTRQRQQLVPPSGRYF